MHLRDCVRPSDIPLGKNPLPMTSSNLVQTTAAKMFCYHQRVLLISGCKWRCE